MIAIFTLLILSALMLGIYMFNSYFFAGAQTLLANSQQMKEELYLVKKSLLVLSTVYDVTVEETTIRYPALPVGVNKGDYHTLPDAFYRTLNPFNKPYIYCPFGAITAPSYTVTINGGSISGVQGSSSIYDANTSVMVKNGKSLDYVTSTEQNKFTVKGVLGFIISPTSNGSTRCQDVTFDTQLQKYIVAGGRVETITSIEVEAVNIK
ncbi:hypothetical protein ACQ9ZH_21035 [Pseudomonas chlororaphis]